MSETRAPGPSRPFGIAITLLMATVSIVSAVVANRAAVWSATSSDLDGQALQEVLEVQQIEDDLRTSVEADMRLVSRYDAAYERSALLQGQADTLRSSDRPAADALDLEAQAESGVDVILWRYFRAVSPSYADGTLVFDPDAALAALRAGNTRLAELGRSETPQLAAVARARTIAFVAIAAVFVAALFALTVAEVTSGRRRLVAAAIGVLLAVGATALALGQDIGSGALIVAILVAAAAVIAVVGGGPRLVRRWRRTPTPAVADPADDGTDAAGPPRETEDAPAPRRDRFPALVGVLLAGATLAGALVGYLQGVASDAADAAARDARDQSLLALTEHQRSNQWSTIQVGHWTEVLEQRARADAARQASRYWQTHGDTTLAQRMSEEADRRSALAERAGLLTELSETHPNGPQADPDFPDRFYAAQSEVTRQRVVLQDLANEAGAQHGGVAASHVAVLATIAIAAYLLGLSLVLEERRQRAVFAVVGTGLLVTSGIAAAWTELASPRQPDAEQRERIAAAYARGSVAAQTARTTAQWEAAEAAYREALALHPGLARAHVDLAGALFSAASPQRIGFASVSTPEAVRAAAAELETARGLGWDDLATRGDGGFYETLLALAEPAGDHAARAVELTAGALDLAPDLPVLQYNHAAALLAAGRIEDALVAYDEGIAVSTATGPDGTPVFTEASRWDVASGALTDLELIGAARREDPQIGSAIEQIRTLIVAGLGDPVTNTDPAAQPVVSDLTLNALPSQLWWEARIEGFDAQRDTVTVVWSYEDPALPGRHVLASHTGPLRLGQTTTAGGFYVDGEAPAYWASRSYLLGSIPHRCLPDGSYRVELFVDGRPAAEPVTRDLDEPELAAESRPDMGVLFCRPADWVTGDEEDGSRASFRSSDGSASMTAYRMLRPRAAAGEPAQSAQVMAELMAAWPGRPQPLTTDPMPDYLMGLDDTYVQWYDGAEGRVKLTAGVDPTGTVYAVALQGTTEWVDGPIASGILGSFTQQ